MSPCLMCLFALLPNVFFRAAQIDHMRWDDRLDPFNHHPYFPRRVTVAWDSTCFRVQKPRDYTFGRHVVNGHYDFSW